MQIIFDISKIVVNNDTLDRAIYCTKRCRNIHTNEKRD